ncbi:MAG: hypothetical protein LBJ31_10670 [Treponema sp.]|jgi:hypothetical protein|nr:hypothetical protein [Treponema sp.]
MKRCIIILSLFIIQNQIFPEEEHFYNFSNGVMEKLQYARELCIMDETGVYTGNDHNLIVEEYENYLLGTKDEILNYINTYKERQSINELLKIIIFEIEKIENGIKDSIPEIDSIEIMENIDLMQNIMMSIYVIKYYENILDG